MKINTETVKFIGFLNMMASMSKNGIRPFSTATALDEENLLYDDKNPIKTEKEMTPYPLISDCIVDENHHDIISTFTKDYAAKGVNVVAMIGDSGNPFVSITSECDDFCVVVENGDWYVL